MTSVGLFKIDLRLDFEFDSTFVIPIFFLIEKFSHSAIIYKRDDLGWISFAWSLLDVDNNPKNVDIIK